MGGAFDEMKIDLVKKWLGKLTKLNAAISGWSGLVRGV
jgi:hypothetical protein